MEDDHRRFGSRPRCTTTRSATRSTKARSTTSPCWTPTEKPVTRLGAAVYPTRVPVELLSIRFELRSPDSSFTPSDSIRLELRSPDSSSTPSDSSSSPPILGGSPLYSEDTKPCVDGSNCPFTYALMYGDADGDTPCYRTSYGTVTNDTVLADLMKDLNLHEAPGYIWVFAVLKWTGELRVYVVSEPIEYELYSFLF